MHSMHPYMHASHTQTRAYKNSHVTTNIHTTYTLDDVAVVLTR